MDTLSSPILNALLGGLLIGAGTATLLLFNGRVAGICGILGQTLRGAVGPSAWRAAFLAGLVLELAEPAAIDFAAIEERFGPSREMPRLKPDQLRPFQVIVKDLPLEGYVVLDVVKGDEDKAVRGVKRVILRRFPPPQKAT